MHVNHTFKHSERAASVAPSHPSSATAPTLPSDFFVGLPELLGSRIDGTVPLSRSLAPLATLVPSPSSVSDAIALSNMHVNPTFKHSERAASLTSSPSSFSDLPPLIPEDTGTGAMFHTCLRHFGMIFEMRHYPSRDVAETVFNTLAIKRYLRVWLEHYSSGSICPSA